MKSNSWIIDRANRLDDIDSLIGHYEALDYAKEQFQELESRIVILEKMRMEEAFEKQARIDLLESWMSQTQYVSEKLAKALEGIEKSSYVQSSSFAEAVHAYAYNALQIWNEHQEWKQERDCQFCKHVEKEEEDDESPY